MKWNIQAVATREILKMEGKYRYMNYFIFFIRYPLPCFRGYIYWSFFPCCRMEGKAEYTLPPALQTKYVGDMKDGM